MTRKRISTDFIVLCLVVLCAAGAWISGQLLKQQADLWGAAGADAGLFSRVCLAAAPAGFDCTGALKSTWSELTVLFPYPSPDSWIELRGATVPVAFLGLGYFIFIGVWFAFIGPPRHHGRRWHALPLGVGVAGLLVSLYMTGVMVLGLTPWCLWCVIVHVINLLMVVMIWGLRRGPACPTATADGAAAPLATLARQVLTFKEVSAVLAFAVVLIAGLWLYRSERLAMHGEMLRLVPYKNLVKALTSDREFVLREYHAQPQQEVLPASLGHPQLVVFSDYECRVCACPSRGVQRQAVTAFEGKLDVAVRHFPLSKECNPHVSANVHPNSCDAAYAAEAARLQGGDKAFWRMHDLLYRHRKNLNKAIYADLAAQLALNVRQFLSDLYSEQVQAAVAADIELAAELGVQATPTLFLNGRRVTSLIQTPTFWQAAAGEWFAGEGKRTVHTAGFERPAKDDEDCLEQTE